MSPGFNVPVVRREDDPSDDGAVIDCMKWGLIPSFTKKNEKADHYKMVKDTAIAGFQELLACSL